MTDIVIIQGHPDSTHPHFCHALAEAYRKGAEAAGHGVTMLDVGAVDVVPLRDPAEWKAGGGPGYAAEAQRAITAAQHVVLIYPLWMGTMPAHLKAWLERVFTEEFAFDITAKGWTPKLKGRSARVVVTMGMPAFFYRYFFFAHSLKSLRRNILGFAGFGPIRDSLVGTVEAEDPSGRQKWLDRMEGYGRRAA